MNLEEQLKEKIRSIPGYPKPGIIFRDITTLLQDPEGFKAAVDGLTLHLKDMKFDYIAGIEARGFILGGALAYNLGKGFIPIRKKGKLPAETVSMEYELEYGTDIIEVHADCLEPGQRVVVVDDLLATGGTSIAAARLIEKIGGEVVELVFVIDLPDVGGRTAIKDQGFRLFYLCEFEGD